MMKRIACCSLRDRLNSHVNKSDAKQCGERRSTVLFLSSPSIRSRHIMKSFSFRSNSNERTSCCERARSRHYTNTDERSSLAHRRKMEFSFAITVHGFSFFFFSPSTKKQGCTLHVMPDAPMSLQPRDAALRQAQALLVFIHNDKWHKGSPAYKEINTP